jgi:hypothetical protein
MTARLRERLGRDPGDPLNGMIREDGPEVLGDIETGDNIAVDGTWWRVITSTRAGERVEVQFWPPSAELPDASMRTLHVIAGDWNTPVILAHPCCQIPARHKRYPRAA